jgi:hypothetical protein
MGTEEREAVKERENAELGTRNPEPGAAGEALTRWLSANADVWVRQIEAISKEERPLNA